MHIHPSQKYSFKNYLTDIFYFVNILVFNYLQILAQIAHNMFYEHIHDYYRRIAFYRLKCHRDGHITAPATIPSPHKVFGIVYPLLI
jgi:hypothetical protein